jgi:hypothetical protein
MIQFLFSDANALRLSQNMCSRLCGDASLGPLKEVDLEGKRDGVYSGAYSGVYSGES